MNLEINPYDALVNVPARNLAAAAEGLLRVKPCDPEASFFYIKVTLFQRPAGHMYGANMPLTGGLLPQGQLDAIADWIRRGAPRFESVDGGGAACP
jgi:hypothetical protein